MASLFSRDDNNITRLLKPNSTGMIDIVNDYAWTLSPKEARSDVPYAAMTEYQQTTAQLLASMAYYYKQGAETLESAKAQVLSATNSLKSGSASNAYSQVMGGMINGSWGGTGDYKKPYQYRYFAEKTGFQYKFPYFNSKKFERSTSFSPNNGLAKAVEGISTINKIGGFLKNFGEGLTGAFTSGKFDMVEAQTWDSTKEGNYTIRFDLLNTGTYDDIQKNREFCYLITYQNSPSKRNFFITDPPVIYDMFIPDVISLPACYISGINIENIGNTQIIENLTIPEAYSITLTIHPLFDPSRNIMNGVADASQQVVAIADHAEFQNAFNDFSSKLKGLTTSSASPSPQPTQP